MSDQNIRMYGPSPPCAGCMWQSCGMRYTGSVYRCDKPDCMIRRLKYPFPVIDIVTGQQLEAVQFKGDVGAPEIIALDLGCRHDVESGSDVMVINAPTGEEIAKPTDWIIKRADGTLFVRKDADMRGVVSVRLG